VFCTVSRAGKQGEEDAKTSSQKKMVKIEGKKI